jgi:hypothetical protein
MLNFIKYSSGLVRTTHSSQAVNCLDQFCITLRNEVYIVRLEYEKLKLNWIEFNLPAAHYFLTPLTVRHKESYCGTMYVTSFITWRHGLCYLDISLLYIYSTNACVYPISIQMKDYLSPFPDWSTHFHILHKSVLTLRALLTCCLNSAFAYVGVVRYLSKQLSLSSSYVTIFIIIWYQYLLVLTLRVRLFMFRIRIVSSRVTRCVFVTSRLCIRTVRITACRIAGLCMNWNDISLTLKRVSGKTYYIARCLVWINRRPW